MAQYKVIQDIEAEDKLLGPLTLKQFIYAAITIILLFLSYKFATSFHSPYVIIIFLPPILFFGLLAAPLGIDQPNEIWLLAKFRFYLKSQIRKWSQDGVGSLVTVTAPKKVEKKLTKDFTAVEAKSHLESLAKVLDTGGWSSTVSPIFVVNPLNESSDDRLMDLNSIIAGQPTNDIIDQDDIFDENNLQARHISSVMSENEKKMKDFQRGLVSPSPMLSSSDPTPTPSANSNFTQPKEFMNTPPKKMAFEPIESTLNPAKSVSSNLTQTTKPAMTTQTDNAKIDILARDNNRSVSSINRELSGGEVVISLH
jgi:hypothetical protein